MRRESETKLLDLRAQLQLANERITKLEASEISLKAQLFLTEEVCGVGRERGRGRKGWMGGRRGEGGRKGGRGLREIHGLTHPSTYGAQSLLNGKISQPLSL